MIVNLSNNVIEMPWGQYNYKLEPNKPLAVPAPAATALKERFKCIQDFIEVEPEPVVEKFSPETELKADDEIVSSIVEQDKSEEVIDEPKRRGRPRKM